MLFEQHQPQDLLTPSIGDNGVHHLNSSLTSLDFYLLDDIDAYLPPIQPTKTSKDDLIDDNSQHEEEFLSNFDFADLSYFDEKTDFLADTISIDDIDIEKYISEVSFPSPPTDTNNSPLSNIEDIPSISQSVGDDSTFSTDMVVPPSPSARKTKLSTVERKLRKKDQNKTAAEKYRIKKKSERHQLLDRHSALKSANKELKSELENLTYRIQQFKQLFVDLLQIDPSSISN